MKLNKDLQIIDQLFLDVREVIGSIPKEDITPLISLEELKESVGNNNSEAKKFIDLISNPANIQYLINSKGLPYVFIGADSTKHVDFYANEKRAFLPLKFVSEINDLQKTFYSVVKANEGIDVSLNFAKENFPIKIDSAYRSPAYQIWVMCDLSNRHSQNWRYKTLDSTLEWVALPGTSEHGKISPAIDIEDFQLSQNFKSQDEVRSSPYWKLFKEAAKKQGFTESFPKGTYMCQSKGEPWHFYKKK